MDNNLGELQDVLEDNTYTFDGPTDTASSGSEMPSEWIAVVFGNTWYPGKIYQTKLLFHRL